MLKCSFSFHIDIVAININPLFGWLNTLLSLMIEGINVVLVFFKLPELYMNKLKIGLLAILGIFLLNGCEGPAEKKGKKIDNAIEEVKDKVQNKGPAQKAGEKIDEISGN
jgi:hypothetical protein